MKNLLEILGLGVLCILAASLSALALKGLGF